MNMKKTTKPTKFRPPTNRGADVDRPEEATAAADPALNEAKEERRAKAQARRQAFEATVLRLRETESLWRPFVELHAAVKALPTAEERRDAATTLARLLRRPAGPKREERLRARLAKLDAQRQKLTAQLAEA
jgi:hypothetical protein